MLWLLLRAFACLFFIAHLLASISAKAESHAPPYARAVVFSEMIEALHCPSCSVAQVEANGIYYVRTVEGLNVGFADDSNARHAANLLNEMIEASGRRDKAVYQLALEEYAEMTQREAESSLGSDDGIFRLLDPRGDLSSLAKFVVPSFSACEARLVARVARVPDHASHTRTKWTKHGRGPLVSLR